MGVAEYSFSFFIKKKKKLKKREVDDLERDDELEDNLS